MRTCLLSDSIGILSPSVTLADVGEKGVRSTFSKSSNPHSWTQSPSLSSPTTLSTTSFLFTVTNSISDATSSMTFWLRSYVCTVPSEKVIVASLALSTCICSNSWSSLFLSASSNFPKFVHLVTSSNLYCLLLCTSTLLFPQFVHGLYLILFPFVAILITSVLSVAYLMPYVHLLCCWTLLLYFVKDRCA